LTKEIYEALTSLYQSVNVSQKLFLKNKITHARMSNNDPMANYLMKITKLRDWCFVIGMKIDNKELVAIALANLSPPWKDFVQGVYAQEHLPTFTIFGTHSKKKQGKK
jgi:hypothetical protein